MSSDFQVMQEAKASIGNNFDLYNQHKMDTDLVIHNQAIGHSV